MIKNFIPNDFFISSELALKESDFFQRAIYSEQECKIKLKSLDFTLKSMANAIDLIYKKD